MTNPIDSVASRLDETRIKGEDDWTFAIRILAKAVRTYEATHADGWTCDREDNTHTLEANGRVAYIQRDPRKKTWAWFVSVYGAKTPMAEGTCNALDVAMQVCSLLVRP